MEGPTTESGPVLLDLGCGQRKVAGDGYSVVGLDIWIESDADIRASGLSIPLKECSVHRIYSRHFLEHFDFDHLTMILAECRRILIPGGRFEVIVPHYSCISAFQDPTHKTFFSARTFDKLRPFGFRRESLEFHWFREPYTGRFAWLIKLVNKAINGLRSFERFFGLIGGVYEIKCVLAKDMRLFDAAHTPGACLSE